MLDDVLHAAELERRESWAKAHAAYTRALCRARSSSNHDKARLYAERGRCGLRRGQPCAALRDFDAAIHLAPDVAGYWQLRAQARRRLGEEDLALEDVAVSAELDAERLSGIFSQLLPPVDRSSSNPAGGESNRRASAQRRRVAQPTRTVLPRDERGLAAAKKSPERCFAQVRPELREAASAYARRVTQRQRDAVWAQQQAEAREQERLQQEAQAEAEAQAEQKLRVLHGQYLELELASARSQLLQLADYSDRLAQKIVEIDQALEAGEHSKAVLAEEVNMFESGSKAMQQSSRAAKKREELEFAVQAKEARLQRKKETQKLQHEAAQQQVQLRKAVQRLRGELNQL
jgi:hypothetical protein